jgi:AraC-like DNA-binding protein
MIAYFVIMLEELHIEAPYEGFLFLAESLRNPPALKPHRHVELELNLVAAGEIRYVVEDRSYLFPAGTLLWLFPEQTHQLVDRSPDARYFVAVFTPEMLSRHAESARYAPLRAGRPPHKGVLQCRLDAMEFDMLRQMMAEICAGGQDPDVLNREAGFGLSPGFRFRHPDAEGLNAGLRHVLLLAWRLQGRGTEPARVEALHPAIRRALEKINQEDPPPRLEELARRCGVSASTLSRVFRRQMGIPLNRYRNSVMLARFLRLAEPPRSLTLLEAVHAAGFGSYAQFYRVFRRAYGENPRAALNRPGAD